jgi:CBS domain-containing protein
MPAYDDDDVERVEREELPGPADLDLVLTSETITDAIANPPLILDAGTSLAETLRRMREQSRGCVLVVQNGKLVGIFTERDVLLRVAGQPIDLEQTTVSAYMTKDPVHLPADSSVAFALNKMVVEGFRHIPLVDEEGRPSGVVSMRELIEYLSGFFSKELLTLPPNPGMSFRNRDGA